MELNETRQRPEFYIVVCLNCHLVSRCPAWITGTPGVRMVNAVAAVAVVWPREPGDASPTGWSPASSSSHVHIHSGGQAQLVVRFVSPSVNKGNCEVYWRRLFLGFERMSRSHEDVGLSSIQNTLQGGVLYYEMTSLCWVLAAEEEQLRCEFRRFKKSPPRCSRALVA